MFRKTNVLAVTLCTTALIAAACGTDATGTDGQKYSLKYTSYNVADASEGLAAKQWAKDIEEATGGRVKIEMFFQEALLKGSEALRGVADGRADVGFLANGYYPAELPLTGVAGIPFLTEDMAVQSKAFYQLYKENPALEAEYKDQGLHVLTWAAGPPSIIAMKKPADQLSDLANRKIRGYGYISNALAALGANPVAMGQGEVYEAIQRGVLDGTSGGGFDVMFDRSFPEVAPNLYDANFGTFAMTMTVINAKLWNDFPDDIKDAFNQAGTKYLENVLANTEKAENALCDRVLASDKIAMHVYDQKEISSWVEQVGPQIRETWFSDVAETSPGTDAKAFYDDYVKALQDNPGDPEYLPGLKRCAARQHG